MGDVVDPTGVGTEALTELLGGIAGVHHQGVHLADQLAGDGRRGAPVAAPPHVVQREYAPAPAWQQK